MKVPFYKYHGTGNDFVLLDQRTTTYVLPDDEIIIRQICNRRFGVGADGLIFLQNHPECDFEMVYFNSDGRPSSMCGNGGRCMVAFARDLGLICDSCRFLATDGLHEARINQEGWVELKMSDVADVEAGEDYFILNTGSPHYVIFVEDISDLNIVQSAQVIRYSERFCREGINVNFVEDRRDGTIEVVTYERGVEAETLSCGTGVTASAIAWAIKRLAANFQVEIPVVTKGGILEVRFRGRPDGSFCDIWLCGPAVRVFEGWLDLQVIQQSPV